MDDDRQTWDDDMRRTEEHWRWWENGYDLSVLPVELRALASLMAYWQNADETIWLDETIQAKTDEELHAFLASTDPHVAEIETFIQNHGGADDLATLKVLTGMASLRKAMRGARHEIGPP